MVLMSDSLNSATGVNFTVDFGEHVVRASGKLVQEQHKEPDVRITAPPRFAENAIKTEAACQGVILAAGQFDTQHGRAPSVRGVVASARGHLARINHCCFASQFRAEAAMS